MSTKALLTIGGLLIIVYAVYAMLGVFLFYNVAHGAYIDDHANFDNFGTAFMVMFRSAGAL